MRVNTLMKIDKKPDSIPPAGVHYTSETKLFPPTAPTKRITANEWLQEYNRTRKGQRSLARQNQRLRALTALLIAELNEREQYLSSPTLSREIQMAHGRNINSLIKRWGKFTENPVVQSIIRKHAERNTGDNS